MARKTRTHIGFKPHSQNRFPHNTLTLLDLWEASAQKSPDAPALIMGEESWSFERLDQRAEQLASWLAENGIEPGDRVGICLERSFDLIASLLAAMKRQAAYVPLDTSLPPARFAHIAQDAGLKGVLTTSELYDQLGLNGAQPLFLDYVKDRGFKSPPKPGPDKVSDDAPMYILYTSGSTGKPKGVAMGKLPPGSLVQWQMADHREFGSLRTLQFTALSFDVSVQEIFSTLCAGQSLVLVEEHVRRDGQALVRLLERHSVERIFLPFVALQQLATAACGLKIFPASLKVVVTAGEPLHITPAIASFFKELNGCRLLNQYGPTESHTVVTQYTMPGGDSSQWPVAPPIGRALANADLYILDSEGNPVEQGVQGDLYIGGLNVLALGYWNNPQLTAQSFVEHPRQKGQRLYRTGDVALLDHEGQIVFLGRSDHQVKIRGHRVELGEVENNLLNMPGVDQAAVVAVKDFSGAHQLRAFFVSAKELDPQELLSGLSETLPEYMLPANLTRLTEMPLSTNNKVDRVALASLGTESKDEWQGKNRREGRIAEIWRQTLGLEKASPEQNFFRMGGHSLLATRLLAEIKREIDCELSFSDLLSAPTLGRLLVRIKESKGRGGALPQAQPDPAVRHEPFPLTDVQQAYWLGRHSVFELGGVSTHLYLELENSVFEPERMEWAWNQLIKRHDMLRAVTDQEGRQRILPQTPDYSVRISDLRELDQAQAQEALEAVRQEMSHQVFDTAVWPLFDIRISRLPHANRLHLSFDILILDALSQYILLDEWHELCQDPDWRPPELPEASFRDYLLAEQVIKDTGLYQESFKYWEKQIQTMPTAPDLPLDQEKQDQEAPVRFGRLRKHLSGPVWTNLRERAARAGVTPSAVLLTAYAEVLATWSKSEHFTLNLTLFNRLPLCQNVERLVGDFTSVSLLEVDLRKEKDFISRTAALQDRLWKNLDHRYMSGVEALRLLRRKQGAGADAVGMPVIFTSALGLGAYDREFKGYAQMGSEVYGITQTSQAWLDHQVWEQQGGLTLVWDYRKGLFPPDMLQDMFEVYLRRITELARDAAAWRRAWRDTLPQAQQEIMARTNATGSNLPTTTLHQEFMARARENPEATAVLHPGGGLTYGHLAQLAEAHAALLLQNGVQPGDRVIIAMEHSWEQVAAVLAVSCARGVYVPLNPLDPPARLESIAKRLEAKALFTQPWLSALDWAGAAKVITVTDQPEDGRPETAGADGSKPSDLAYIIFTSGSTGEPKGVVINHLGAQNTICDINRRMNIHPGDRVLGLSSLGFDLSVWDIFGPLSAGATLVLPEPRERKDPVAWVRLMKKHGISVWNSVPAFFQMLVEYLKGEELPAPSELRLAMLSGDWLPVSLPPLAKRLWPALELYSLGGATEASIWSICHLVEEADYDQPSIPYGKPMANQTFRVLDKQGRPCPVWKPGELYIGGVGLALEYWRDEEKTAQSFVRLGRDADERLYRTGDWGMYLPGGDIRFLGRKDLQVKIAGHRIELGEIEEALSRAPGVKQAQVITAQVGGTSLVGFVTARGICHPETILKYLAERLPAYMVPARIQVLESWPLNPNGKVDRKALAGLVEIKEEPVRPTTERKPSGALEKSIAQLWSQVLGGRIPLRDESFYECGGDSLSATQLFLLLKKRFGPRDGFSVVSIFEHPTVARQASFFTQETAPPVESSQMRGAQARRMTAALRRGGTGQTR